MDQDQRKEWLNSLVISWDKPLLRLCFAFQCDTTLAEDAEQETFIKAWKGADRFRAK